VKGQPFVVMDQGKGNKVLEQCGEEQSCLEKMGLKVRPYNEFAREIKSLVDAARQKK